MILPRRKPIFIKVHQVGPCGVELGFPDRPAGSMRVDAMAEQQLVPVDVADAGDDRLIHQQRSDWPARLGDPRPRPRRVGVAAKRVRPEPSHHIGDLRVVDQLAHGGAAQIGAVFGTDHPHPHLPDRSRHRNIGRALPFGESPVQTEVHVHGRAANVMVKQMLTPRAGAPQHPAIDSGCRIGESTLRTRDRHRRTGIAALVQPGQPVQGMPFGHACS